MGVFDCCAAAITGYFDVFDRAEAAVTDIEKKLPPIQYHAPTTFRPDLVGHFFDPAEEERLRLDYAVGLIREACQIAQEVLEGIE